MKPRYSHFVSIEPKTQHKSKGIFDHLEQVEYREVICNDEFLSLGVCPTPKNKKEQFKHDILHGLLMNYPIFKVIEYSIRNYFDHWKNWDARYR